MKGANSGTQVSYDPYTDSQATSSTPRLYTHATAPTGTGRLNLAGYLWATRLHSPGIYGGDLSGNSLTIGSTSHATKGTINLDSNTTISGTLTAPRISLTNDASNTTNHRMTVYDSGTTTYGMML